MNAIPRLQRSAHHSHGPGHALSFGGGRAAASFAAFADAAARPPTTTEDRGGGVCRPMPSADQSLGHFVGHSTGSGQCVALVRAADPTLGVTSTWVSGAPVRGNAALRPGTVIATFDPSGRYANASNGSSHAAIYLGQNDDGMRVLDQWAGKAASVRTIPWSSPGATAANSGNAFRVVRSA